MSNLSRIVLAVVVGALALAAPASPAYAKAAPSTHHKSAAAQAHHAKTLKSAKHAPHRKMGKKHRAAKPASHAQKSSRQAAGDGVMKMR